MPRAARILLLALTASACTRAGDPPRDSDMPRKSLDDLDPALRIYPFNRLVFAHNPVEPLDLALDEAVLKARGVRSHRAFTATAPRVWLLVFEFERQSDLMELAVDPRPLVPGEPPYYLAAAFTGSWLLVAGFPGEKPVSPEMEAARTTFLARWAGEE